MTQSKINVEETLKRIKYETLDDIMNALYDKFKLSFAIFDSYGLLIDGLMDVKRCKCYYMLLHDIPNKCSIFNTDFLKAVLAEKELDKLCDYGCRLTSRELKVGGEMYKFVMFQFNLEGENLEFNPDKNPNFIEIHRGDDPNAADYSWVPNVLTREDRDEIFYFVWEASKKIIKIN